VNDLATLDRSRFEPREYAALAWVRAYLTTPEGVPVEVEEEYYAEFTPSERRYVEASMMGMYCTNLTVNTHRHILGRILRRPESPPEACPL